MVTIAQAKGEYTFDQVKDIRVYAERRLFNHEAVEIVILATVGAGETVVFDGTKFVTSDILSPYAASGFQLWGKRAQELMDDLWRCGVRPAEGTGSAGALVATQRHLETTQAELLRLWDLIYKLVGNSEDE